MTEDLPPASPEQPPPESPAFEPRPEPSPARPERYPFWTYADVLIFAGLAIPSMLIGVLIVRAVMFLLRIRTKLAIAESLPAEFLGYGVLFGAVWLIFRMHYGRPFWRSLAWVDPPIPALRIAVYGLLTAFGVVFVSAFLRTPDTRNPMTDLLQDPRSMIPIAIVGVTLGPLCEELVFRGLLQPLLVRSFGALPGILAAAVPFGLLHLQEYAYSWRHGVLITLAGASFGWMRHVTGSTKAAAIMHAAYNALFFFVLLAQRKDLPHGW
jgi:uncharacterized protein